MSVDAANAAVLLANYLLVPGLSYGAQLALGALGITLVYAVLGFSNFAHGDTMAFGTAITLLVTGALQGAGASLGPAPTALLALPVGVTGAVVLCLFFDRFVYRHYRQVGSSSIVLVIVSVGVMFVTGGIVRLLVGPGDRVFADGERFLVGARAFKAATGLDEGLSIRTTQLLTLVVAIVAMGLLFHFLNRTRTGKAMRAFADNEELARLSGIDPARVVRITWVLVATLATLAGVLYGLDKSFKPFTYFQLLLPMFAAAIVGGIGKPVGAVLGGFVVAFGEIGLTYAWKRFMGYTLPESLAPEGLLQPLSTDYKFAVSFVILVAVLLWRPSGLLGRGETR